MKEIEVLKAPDDSKPFAIIYKPAGLASAPLSNDDNENAFSKAAAIFPQLLKVQGRKEIEHGLLHRIDTATSGLLLIAANQECFDFLIAEQKAGKILKKYYAECNLKKCKMEGFPPLEMDYSNKNTPFDFTLSSYFRPFGEGGKEVRPVTNEAGKAALKKLGKPVIYSTYIKILELNLIENFAKAECTITNGYRHQVRSHLAWSGFPVINDILYNPEKSLKIKNAEPMRFCASSIQFEYPRGDLNSYDRKDTWT